MLDALLFVEGHETRYFSKEMRKVISRLDEITNTDASVG